MRDSLRLLYVDEEPLLHRALERTLFDTKDLIQIDSATSAENIRTLMLTRPYEIIVSDTAFRDEVNIALKDLPQHQRSTQIVWVGEPSKLQNAAPEAKTQWLAKPWSSRELRHAITHAIRRLHDRRAPTYSEPIKNPAVRGHVAQLKAQSPHTCPVLGVLGIDRLRNINQSLGRDVGNALLERFEARLHKVLPSWVCLTRLGGDRYALATGRFETDSEASQWARELLEELAHPFAVDQRTIFVTASLGLTRVTPGEGAETALRRAEEALQSTKRKGRLNHHWIHGEVAKPIADRLAVEAELACALDNDEFSLFFQPQLDIGSKKVRSVEALLRWNHPQLGLVGPAEFIPILEDTGLIARVGDWALREACRFASEWYAREGEYLTVAVNLSARQLTHALPERIETLRNEYGLPNHVLGLELTESVLVEQSEETNCVLLNLRNKGVPIAIDDFGTGYASLGYLARYSPDEIKLDRSFLASVPGDRHVTTIAHAIVQLARDLGLKVTAEGVERPEQLDYLGNIQCTKAQGFLLAKPMSEKSLATWVHDYAT